MKPPIASFVALFVLVGGLAPIPAAGQNHAFEISQAIPNPENIFQRAAYVCDDCNPEIWDAFTPPAGTNKDPIQIQVSDAVLRPPSVLDPGATPVTLDLIPGVPGAEFRLVSKPQSGTILGASPDGIDVLAMVNRDSAFRFDAGGVIHELTDPDGNRYVLISTYLELAESVDLEALDSLSILSFPNGWTYSSRILDSDLTVDSGGATKIVVLGLGRSKWDLYAPATPVPMLPWPTLIALLLGCLGIARLRGSGV